MKADFELDAARLRGDPIADTVIRQLGPKIWADNALMRDCRGNAQALPSQLSPVARRFFEEEARLPTWFERTRVLSAQRWATDHLLTITVALFHASLPSAYAAEQGAKVLLATGRMAQDIDRRVNETARFVIDVLTIGAFEPYGLGIRATQQVRLVHAAVRAWLAPRDGAAQEVPLNQEDLLGTLLTFSVVVVRALRRLDVTVSPADADDFFHLWRVVGSLLGVEDALLPLDFAAAETLAGRISQRHFRSSHAGRLLMDALVTRINEHLLYPAMTTYLIRRLNGDFVADLLGVPMDGQVPSLFSQFARLPFASRVSGQLLSEVGPLIGKPLLNSIVSRKLSREFRGFAARRFDE
ncbi:MAG TPA: oxygenase MpaB family protein [Polyangiaceae bacterium]|nr:oxygenase MpaB family protein [Polyangiaceae bacterium]